MKLRLLFAIVSVAIFSNGALAADREADALREAVTVAIEDAKVKLDGFIADHVTPLRLRYAAIRDQRDPCGQFAALPGLDRVIGLLAQVEARLHSIKRNITGSHYSAEDRKDLGEYYHRIREYQKAIREYEKAEDALAATEIDYHILRSETQGAVGGKIPDTDAALTLVEAWLQARLLQCPRDIQPVAMDVMSSVVESQTVEDSSSSDGVMSTEP